MKITFHGAAQSVTGSKHLISLNNGTKILLDCGMFQGMGKQTDDLNKNLGFEASSVNYLILSHAHIDHCGLIPYFVAQGFTGPIYCTSATIDLAKILLYDSAKIQSQDNQHTNKLLAKKGLPAQAPLYTNNDVLAAFNLFKPIAYNIDFEIEPNIILKFTEAGHIVGSAAVNLCITQNGTKTRITFSGDVGTYGDAILKSPAVFNQADYILLESTYGDTLHKNLSPTDEELFKIIQQTCLVKGGKVIIPAFSVGRTQEILYALNSLEVQGRLPKVAYYVDSPLSIKATDILKKYSPILNTEVQNLLKTDDDVFDFNGLEFIESVEQSKALNADNKPCVIIASSGMADAGRIKHHIKNNISDSKNTILMVGYCSPKSLGGQLLAGNANVYIFGENYHVNAEVQSIQSMSAHGDYEDLLQFIACQNPQKVKKIFLVHGELDTQLIFKAHLFNAGYKNVEIPILHQTVLL